MAQSEYDLYGKYDAVSVSSQSGGTRSLTLQMRPGDSDDPYGGWKGVDTLHDVVVSEVPDGRDLDPEDYPAYGLDEGGDRTVAVFVKEREDGQQVATVAWADKGGA